MWKILLPLGLIALVFLTLALSREMYKKKQVQKEIDNLKAEAERIEKENIVMEDKLAYFESRDFQEKEARDKLNLQNPEEGMVIIKPSISKGAFEDGNEDKQPEIARNEESKSISNQKRWWNYFFKY